MQQDTIWLEDVNKLAIEEKYPNAHLIFDTVGNDQVIWFSVILISYQ